MTRRIGKSNKMKTYENFARVYDELMDNVPYEAWAEFLQERLREYGITDGLMLDLACGTGRMTTLMAGRGFDLIGVDSSMDMLQIARERGSEKADSCLYLLQDMREFELYGTVRSVISVCDSINYVTEEEDLLHVFSLVNNYLDPGGIFLFSCEHPVFTAQGSQDWLYDEKGEIRCFPVDRYYYQGERDAIFLGEHVRKYHRTFTGYLKPLLKLGFTVTDFEEPMPTEEARRTIPGMEDEMRRPMMMIIKATKSATVQTEG